MKRRGFLGLLLSAPLAPVAAKAVISEKPATPAYTFTNDTDTGLFKSTALRVVVAGRCVYLPYFDR